MSDDLLTSQKEEPKWFIDEGLPGVGERPQWLPEKFKTVADMSKSYAELEKKFGTVPEEYDISNSVYLDPDKDIIKDFLQVAKEKRVPKEVVDKMVDTFDRYLGEHDVNTDEEVKKLGDNAAERLKTLNNWAKANLSDDSYKALSKNLQSADSILALEELRGKMMTSSTQIPNGNDGASQNESNTVKDIQDEIGKNYEKYKTDPKYRAELQGKLEVAVKRAGMIDKFGN
jgi:hypothetical protein